MGNANGVTEPNKAIRVYSSFSMSFNLETSENGERLILGQLGLSGLID